jgi:hypothetical protein
MKYVWFTGKEVYVTFKMCTGLLYNDFWFKKQVSDFTHNNRSCRQQVELVLFGREYLQRRFRDIPLRLQIFTFQLKLYTA